MLRSFLLPRASDRVVGKASARANTQATVVYVQTG